jgi:hypothetical protein
MGYALAQSVRVDCPKVNTSKPFWPSPFADPDAAAHKIVEIANGVETVQDGLIYIERVNTPCLTAFLGRDKL